MSEQEQDIVLGRFLREHGEATRKLGVMNAEWERHSKALREIQKLPLAGFDFAGLLTFLQE